MNMLSKILRNNNFKEEWSLPDARSYNEVIEDDSLEAKRRAVRFAVAGVASAFVINSGAVQPFIDFANQVASSGSGVLQYLGSTEAINSLGMGAINTSLTAIAGGVIGGSVSQPIQYVKEQVESFVDKTKYFFSKRNIFVEEIKNNKENFAVNENLKGMCVDAVNLSLDRTNEENKVLPKYSITMRRNNALNNFTSNLLDIDKSMRITVNCEDYALLDSFLLETKELGIIKDSNCMVLEKPDTIQLSFYDKDYIEFSTVKKYDSVEKLEEDLQKYVKIMNSSIRTSNLYEKEKKVFENSQKQENIVDAEIVQEEVVQKKEQNVITNNIENKRQGTIMEDELLAEVPQKAVDAFCRDLGISNVQVDCRDALLKEDKFDIVNSLEDDYQSNHRENLFKNNPNGLPLVAVNEELQKLVNLYKCGERTLRLDKKHIIIRANEDLNLELSHISNVVDLVNHGYMGKTIDNVIEKQVRSFLVASHMDDNGKMESSMRNIKDAYSVKQIVKNAWMEHIGVKAFEEMMQTNWDAVQAKDVIDYEVGKPYLLDKDLQDKMDKEMQPLFKDMNALDNKMQQFIAEANVDFKNGLLDNKISEDVNLKNPIQMDLVEKMDVVSNKFYSVAKKYMDLDNEVIYATSKKIAKKYGNYKEKDLGMEM